jgi:hypothetical protein
MSWLNSQQDNRENSSDTYQKAAYGRGAVMWLGMQREMTSINGKKKKKETTE